PSFPGATPSNAILGTAEVPKLPPNLATGPEVPGVNAPLGPKAPPAKSPIISSPFAEPRMTGSEGRPATWTNEAVMRLAAQGNREAIQQAVRRGFELPPGARYVMGDPDFSRSAYNPREVTRFTPEGTPIWNVEN